MDDWKAAFAEEWDAVVLGTGMKECLLSGLLSVAGKKVLHLDRNDYYGGASASLDIHQLFKKFGQEQPPSEAELGKLRDYSVDLVPKFIMAGGQLVKVCAATQPLAHPTSRPPNLSPAPNQSTRCRTPPTSSHTPLQVLIHTGVHNYMEFKSVDGSFVYSSKAGKVCKVPATPEDAMSSSLMGMMEKTRMVQFTLWVVRSRHGPCCRACCSRACCPRACCRVRIGHTSAVRCGCGACDAPLGSPPRPLLAMVRSTR